METATDAPLWTFIPTGEEKEFAGLRHAVTVYGDGGERVVGVEISSEIYTFLRNIMKIAPDNFKHIELLLDRVENSNKFVLCMEYLDQFGKSDFMDLWTYPGLPKWAEKRWTLK